MFSAEKNHLLTLNKDILLNYLIIYSLYYLCNSIPSLNQAGFLTRPKLRRCKLARYMYVRAQYATVRGETDHFMIFRVREARGKGMTG